MLETVLAVLGVAAFLLAATGTALWWRAAHTVEVRSVVVQFRELFQTLIAHGQLYAPAFLEEDAQRRERELGDLIARLNDRKLRVACQDLRTAYTGAWASSMPLPSGTSLLFTGTADPGRFAQEMLEQNERAKRSALQVQHAREGLDAVRRVLDRINQLERFLPRRG